MLRKCFFLAHTPFDARFNCTMKYVLSNFLSLNNLGTICSESKRKSDFENEVIKILGRHGIHPDLANVFSTRDNLLN
jgi:hypothetical protein